MSKDMGLYRGKPKYKSDIELVRPDVIKDDGFIYGSLVAAEDKYYICIFATCSHKTFVNNTTATMFEIIPETVGQYTGLRDKNGKRIFDGDIINAYHNRDLLNVSYVVFDSGEFLCELISGNFIDCCETLPEQETECGIEIIGNIYDNPELLKGETPSEEYKDFYEKKKIITERLRKDNENFH